MTFQFTIVDIPTRGTYTVADEHTDDPDEDGPRDDDASDETETDAGTIEGEVTVEDDDGEPG